MFPGAIPPNQPRRPRRYSFADVGADAVMLVLIVLVFLLMIVVAALVLGLIP